MITALNRIPKWFWVATTVVALAALIILTLSVVFRVFSDPMTRRWADDDVHAHPEQPYVDLLDFSTKADANGREEAFRHLLKAADWQRPTVSVYSTPNLKPEPPPMTLKDLSGDGQAKVIDLLTRNSGKDEAWLRLSRSLAGAVADVPRRDPYRAERVLVATVAKGLGDEPGNRLLWTRVFIQPINFKFAEYTIAATDNRTVKIATIEDTSNAKLSFEGGLEKTTPGTAKIAADVEQNRKVQADLSQQYEGLGVDIQPGFLRIIRESAAGGDVAGNTGIALSVLTDPQMIVKTFVPRDRDDTPPTPTPVLLIADEHLTGSNGDLQPQLTVLPEDALPHCSLKARVWMLYEARQIVRGGAQYQEGLQSVRLTQNADGIREVEIVPADDISPTVWSIRTGEDVEHHKRFLMAKAKGAQNARKVVFTDYVLASQLIHWLKEHPPTTKGGSPSIGELTFYTLDEQGLSYDQALSLTPYKETQDACQPAR